LDVFELRDQLIVDYRSYVRSFIGTWDVRIWEYVRNSLAEGLLSLQPLIQHNSSFETHE
jgi:hypothetical protein